MNIPASPMPLPPICQSALDALLTGDIDGQAFVWYCNMVASDLLEWALTIASIIKP